MIHDFVALFTEKKIDAVHIFNKYFYANKYLEKYRLQAKERVFGLYLGEEKEGVFIPSFNLLDWLAHHSKEKVFVKDIGEMDFLYGKNLRARHVEKVEGKPGHSIAKLVQNKYDENLGYGIIIGDVTKKEQVLKHKKDRGDFLKRERAQKD
ncbi:MAG TPA: hypothetical protein VJJ79_01000 [Candidatus Nanoarchaeia archaeon]|nr:hypothetical protein [Candidatus Nanoarchaeia archaeon]